MADKVKLSKDGSSIDFVQSDNVPTSIKKFRQSPEIEGFYRFIYENDLQKEAFEILDRISLARKAKKSADKAQARMEKKEASKVELHKAKIIEQPIPTTSKTTKTKINEKPIVKVEPKKTTIKASEKKQEKPIKAATKSKKPAITNKHKKKKT